MDIEKVKEIYSKEHVKDILEQLESYKLQHEKRNPHNNCSERGKNIEKLIKVHKIEKHLILSFGMFTIALVKLIVALLKKDKK